MAFKDKIWNFLASKWLSFSIGILMIILLPFTWHNFTVIYDAKAISANFTILAVFIINILSIGICTYKFLGSKEKEKQEDWDEDESS